MHALKRQVSASIVFVEPTARICFLTRYCSSEQTELTSTWCRMQLLNQANQKKSSEFRIRGGTRIPGPCDGNFVANGCTPSVAKEKFEMLISAPSGQISEVASYQKIVRDSRPER